MSWLSQATGIHWGDVSKPIATGLGAILAPFTGGASALAAAAYDAGPGARGTPHHATPTDPGMSAPGAADGSGGSGGVDPWSTLLGAAGAIQSGADAQRQGALLNNALAAYNQAWTRGRGIRLAQHPVDLSQTFADPSNPFYSPSAGAVPTIDANGNPLAPPAPGGGGGGAVAPPLPGVPPLQAPAHPIGFNPANPMPRPGGIFGSPFPRPNGGQPLPGVPPLNLGGPSSAVPVGLRPPMSQVV